MKSVTVQFAVVVVDDGFHVAATFSALRAAALAAALAFFSCAPSVCAHHGRSVRLVTAGTPALPNAFKRTVAFHALARCLARPSISARSISTANVSARVWGSPARWVTGPETAPSAMDACRSYQLSTRQVCEWTEKKKECVYHTFFFRELLCLVPPRK